MALNTNLEKYITPVNIFILVIIVIVTYYCYNNYKKNCSVEKMVAIGPGANIAGLTGNTTSTTSGPISVVGPGSIVTGDTTSTTSGPISVVGPGANIAGLTGSTTSGPISVVGPGANIAGLTGSTTSGPISVVGPGANIAGLTGSTTSGPISVVGPGANIAGLTGSTTSGPISVVGPGANIAGTSVNVPVLTRSFNFNINGLLNKINDQTTQSVSIRGILGLYYYYFVTNELLFKINNDNKTLYIEPNISSVKLLRNNSVVNWSGKLNFSIENNKYYVNRQYNTNSTSYNTSKIDITDEINIIINHCNSFGLQCKVVNTESIYTKINNTLTNTLTKTLSFYINDINTNTKNTNIYFSSAQQNSSNTVDVYITFPRGNTTSFPVSSCPSPPPCPVSSCPSPQPCPVSSCPSPQPCPVSSCPSPPPCPVCPTNTDYSSSVSINMSNLLSKINNINTQSIIGKDGASIYAPIHIRLNVDTTMGTLTVGFYAANTNIYSNNYSCYSLFHSISNKIFFRRNYLYRESHTLLANYQSNLIDITEEVNNIMTKLGPYCRFVIAATPVGTQHEVPLRFFISDTEANKIGAYVYFTSVNKIDDNNYSINKISVKSNRNTICPPCRVSSPPTKTPV
jgi:hypothetical protein